MELHSINFDYFMELLYSIDMFTRAYEPLQDHIHPSKVTVIYGPRRVGKTTLLKKFLETSNLKFKLETGDDILTRQVMGSQSISQISSFVEGYELLAIDEAQNIPHIGMGLRSLWIMSPVFA